MTNKKIAEQLVEAFSNFIKRDEDLLTNIHKERVNLLCNSSIKDNSSNENLITKWMSRLSLLYGIPINYLIPDPEILPQESIKFFYMDQNWLSALTKGAYSIGSNTHSDKMHDSYFSPISQKISKKNSNLIRSLCFTNNLSLKASVNLQDINSQVVQTGFLLRSLVVKDWPNLEIFGYDKNDKLLDIIRMDRITPEILICIFAGEVHSIKVSPPVETVHWGFDMSINDSNKFEKKLRDKHGDFTGNKVHITNEQYFRDTDGALKIAELAKDLSTNTSSQFALQTNSPSQFALQMVVGVDSAILTRSYETYMYKTLTQENIKDIFHTKYNEGIGISVNNTNSIAQSNMPVLIINNMQDQQNINQNNENILEFAISSNRGKTILIDKIEITIDNILTQEEFNKIECKLISKSTEIVEILPRIKQNNLIEIIPKKGFSLEKGKEYTVKLSNIIASSKESREGVISITLFSGTDKFSLTQAIDLVKLHDENVQNLFDPGKMHIDFVSGSGHSGDTSGNGIVYITDKNYKTDTAIQTGIIFSLTNTSNKTIDFSDGYFTLSFVVGSEYFALFDDKAQLKKLDVAPYGDGERWEIIPNSQGRYINWRIQPPADNTKLGGGKTVEISIQHIVSTLPVGKTLMYLSYKNIEDYNDGSIALVLEKTEPIATIQEFTLPHEIEYGEDIEVNYAIYGADSWDINISNTTYNIVSNANKGIVSRGQTLLSLKDYAQYIQQDQLNRTLKLELLPSDYATNIIASQIVSSAKKIEVIGPEANISFNDQTNQIEGNIISGKSCWQLYGKYNEKSGEKYQIKINNTDYISAGKFVYDPFTDNYSLYELRAAESKGNEQEQYNLNLEFDYIEIFSKPVVYKDYIYFQGTDDQIMRQNINNLTLEEIGASNLTSTAVCVMKDYIYFADSEKNLVKCKIDGTDKKILKEKCIKSSPVIVQNNMIYFQGINDLLCSINIDGNNFQEHKYKIYSSPAVFERSDISSSVLIFVSEGNRIVRLPNTKTEGYTNCSPAICNIDYNTVLYIYQNHDNNNLYWGITGQGGNHIKKVGDGFIVLSSPQAGYPNCAIFQGEGNKLTKVDNVTSDKCVANPLGAQLTTTTPYYYKENVYFKDENNYLRRINIYGASSSLKLYKKYKRKIDK